MEKSRLTKSSINIIINIIFSLAGLFLGMFRTKLFLSTYGSEMNGIYQFILQYVSFLSIAEMGLAQLYNLKAYKYAAENNREGLSLVYNGAKYFVRIILAIMILMIIVISIFIQFIRPEASIPTIQIIILFVIICLPNLVSHMLLPNYVIVNSKQESYIYNFWRQFFIFVKMILSFYYITKLSFTYFIIVEILIEILGYFVVKLRTDKIVKRVLIKTIDREVIEFKNVNDFLKIRISILLIEYTDNTIITKYFSFVALSVFSSYTYVTNILYSNISFIFDSCLHSLGHLFASNEDYSPYIVRVLKALGRFLGLYMAILIIFFAERLVLFIAANADVNYSIDNYSNLIIAGTILIKIYLQPYWIMISSKGTYMKAKKALYFEAVFNIIISIILIKMIGVFGALLGTLISKVFIALPNYFNASTETFCKKDLGFEYCKLIFCFMIMILFNSIYINFGFKQFILNSQFIDLLYIAIPLAIIIGSILFGIWLIIDKDFRYFVVENLMKIKGKLLRR
ncbi:MAG: hypothetical protein RR623_08350 [Bacilli bacterium]